MDIYFLDNGRGKTIKGRAFVAQEPKVNIVFLTGMCEHATRYGQLGKFLNEKGISLYVQDAPGQGLNIDKEKGKGPQEWELNDFDDTVDFAFQKIEELKKDTSLPTGIMGHSMGSFMVQRYLERHPGTVSFVGLIGSNGPCLAKMKISFALASFIVNKRNWDKPSHFIQSMGLGAYSRAIKGAKTPLDWLSYNEDNVKAYADDPLCGIRNTNGFWKEFLRGMSHLYEKKELRKISRDEKILLLAGEGDPVGEFGKGVRRLYDMYKKIKVKDVKCIVYPNMRHEIINERENKQVYDEIANWALRSL